MMADELIGLTEMGFVKKVDETGLLAVPSERPSQGAVKYSNCCVCLSVLFIFAMVANLRRLTDDLSNQHPTPDREVQNGNGTNRQFAPCCEAD